MTAKKLQRFSLFILFCSLLGTFVPANAQNFRVTLNSVVANHLSNEGVLDSDGDEITLQIFVGTVNSSAVFVNPLRRLPVFMEGGLRERDCRPAVPCPPGRLISALSHTDSLPLSLFEGSLPIDQGILIIPTIWETDGNEISWDLLNDFTGALGRSQRAFAQIAGGLVAVRSSTSFIRTPPNTGIPNTMTFAGGIPKTRPIGTTALGGFNQFGFTPQMLVFNSQVASTLSRRNITGRGNGIIEVRYVDTAFMGGDYSLFLQIDMTP